MDRADFIKKYPRLFHMATGNAWPSIEQRGLMSTRSLVELYEPPAPIRDEILKRIRRKSYRLEKAGLPPATVRDQLPLKFLDSCLLPGATALDFLDALNSRVFFHVAENRLHTLLRARAYRNHMHDVLIIDTRRLLDLHSNVDLAPYNTGSVHVPNMPRRGPTTFSPLEDYDWEHWRSRRGEANAVVELTVYESADVAPALIRVEQWRDGRRTDVVVER